MGWLKRLFGMDEKPAEQMPRHAAMGGGGGGAAAQEVPAERVGLNGEYDQSGLAKRVALAFDQQPDLKDIETVYVAQTGGTVVLKGRVPSRHLLDRLETIAYGVPGATAVDSTQVQIEDAASAR